MNQILDTIISIILYILIGYGVGRMHQYGIERKKEKSQIVSNTQGEK